MLTDDERRRGAQLLFDAERQRKAIPQLSQTFPRMEIVDAYRIQDLRTPFADLARLVRNWPICSFRHGRGMIAICAQRTAGVDDERS